ncbi:SH3 domain-containing protein [Elusimicrobiota bacterium]
MDINKRRLCLVIKDYIPSYPDPLIISKEERLKISDKKSEWDGWVWCMNTSGKSGWVPLNFVEVKDSECIALQDYDSGELGVKAGQGLMVTKEESGWVLCVNDKGGSGWVPKENIELL